MTRTAREESKTCAEKEGMKVEDKIEELSYGKFGWVDPEGNKIELREPPRNYLTPEKQFPSE